MINIYLNSLYNFFYRHNPILLMWQHCHKNWRLLRNFKRNMGHAQQKLSQLEHRLERMDANVNYKTPSNQKNLDTYR